MGEDMGPLGIMSDEGDRKFYQEAGLSFAISRSSFATKTLTAKIAKDLIRTRRIATTEGFL